MKKPLLFLILLCSLLLSFSQKEISNETHPFQVLFVDSANYIGRKEEVSQFDFLSINDSLQVEGEMVLVHFTGKISVLNNLSFHVEDLAKIRFKEGVFQRPTISSNISAQQGSINFRERLNPNIVGRICTTQPIQIIYPIFNGEEIIADKSKEEFHLVWKSNEDYGNYIVSCVDIFDEELFKSKTDSTHLKIPMSLFSGYDLIIGEIKVKDGEETSGTFAIRFQETPKIGKFEKIIKALEEQWTGNLDVSNLLFEQVIEESNQDPRFIELYEDFLRRNPQFKEETE